MKKAEIISKSIYIFCIPIVFLPILILVSLGAKANFVTILLEIFIMNFIAVSLGKLIKSKYISNILPYVFGVSFCILNIHIDFFWRIFLAIFAVIICMLTKSKNFKTISSIYFFSAISFIDAVIAFIFKYISQEKYILISAISYIIFTFSYIIFSYCKSKSLFYKKSTSEKVNFKIFIIPITSFVLLTILAFPLSDFLYGFLGRILKIIFSQSSKENIQTPQNYPTQSTNAVTDTTIISGNGIVKYILTAVIIAVIIAFIFFMRYEIVDFFKKTPKYLAKKRLHRNSERLIVNEEFTDVIIEIQPISINMASSNFPKRKWKKDYNLYRKLEWSQEKIRKGFELSQNGLILCGVEIKPNETISEIEKKLPNDYAGLWNNMSSLYISLKYNEILPSENKKVHIDNMLSFLKNEMKSKHK